MDLSSFSEAEEVPVDLLSSDESDELPVKVIDNCGVWELSLVLIVPCTVMELSVGIVASSVTGELPKPLCSTIVAKPQEKIMNKKIINDIPLISFFTAFEYKISGTSITLSPFHYSNLSQPVVRSLVLMPLPMPMVMSRNR